MRKIKQFVIKHFFIFITTVVLFTSNAFSQLNKYGVPFITNYIPKEYGEHSQNWDIVQDNRGVMYFANGNGVLEYDGANWRLIEVANKSTVWTLAVDTATGLVFVGANGEFGCLLPDSLGLMQYFSLSQFLDSTVSKFGRIYSTIVMERGVYLNTKNHIYRFNKQYLPKLYNNEAIAKDSLFRYWKSESSFRILCRYKNDLFISQKKIGLMKIQNDALFVCDTTQNASGRYIIPVFILERKGQAGLLCSFDSELFGFGKENNYTLSDVNFKDEKKLINEICYNGISIDAHELAFVTLKNGLYISKPDGKITNHINEKFGLQNNMAFDVSLDMNNNIWLALNTGISKLETSSPLSVLDESAGLKGYISDIIRYRDTLYVATSLGVYYLDYTSGYPNFIPVEGGDTECWNFVNFSIDSLGINKLLVGSNTGISEIKDSKSTTIISGNYNYKIHQSPKAKNVLFCGRDNGLFYLKYTDGKWSDFSHVDEITNAVFFIDSDNEGNLWVSTDYNGVYKLDFAENMEKCNLAYYDTTSGLPLNERINVSCTDKYVFALTEKGLYQYDKNENTFKSSNVFGSFFAKQTLETSLLKMTPNGDAIINFIENKKDCLAFVSFDKETKEIHHSFPFQRLQEKRITTIYPEKDSIIWFGSPNGLFSYNSAKKKKQEKKFYALIRKVISGNDSVLYYGTDLCLHKSEQNNQPQSKIAETKLNYRNNDISFYYVSPYFVEEKSLKYSYYLEGYDKKWSDWTTKREKEYTNLFEGKYTFKVKALNIYKRESEIAEYTFTILPPWYRRTLAFVVYLILTIILIRLIVKIYTRRLIKEKERLEAIVKERTAKVVRQKDELFEQKEMIQAQADELEIKNIELEKLSIVASETDNAVVIMDEKGNFEWVNEGFSRMFGYQLPELIEHKGKNIIGNETTDEIKNLIKSCIQNKRPVIYEFEISTK